VGTGTTACIAITITDDNNLEGDHTFTVDLLNIQIIGDDLRRMVSMIGIGSPSSTTVTIQDPEGMLSVPSRMDLLCIVDIQISKQEVRVPHHFAMWFGNTLLVHLVYCFLALNFVH